MSRLERINRRLNEQVERKRAEYTNFVDWYRNECDKPDFDPMVEGRLLPLTALLIAAEVGLATLGAKLTGGRKNMPEIPHNEDLGVIRRQFEEQIAERLGPGPHDLD